MRYVSPILAALALVLLLGVTPAGAQDSDAAKPDAREAQLREWFNGLGKNRQEELKKRFRAFKHLPKERQQQILQAAKDGKPILTDKQRDNLKKLKKFSFLERVRLYTTAAELNALTHGPRGKEAREAFEKGDQEALRRMMTQQRMSLFARNMTPEEKREFFAMTPEERTRKIIEERKARLEELTGIYPRFAELREAAESGDKDARKELKHLVADLRTLDLLLQRLEPDKRAEMMAELKDLSLEDAANEIRKALQDQWKEEKRRNPRDNNDAPPRMVPNRDGRRPDRRGPREQ
ncbi:MAG: hypothetical protein H6839_01210 [Planctomycetes bacterium]|nr:hypothetical protein [Planctomycetota bacterium]